MEFSLRFTLDEIAVWAAEYPGEYDSDVEARAPRIREAGLLDEEDLVTLARWKSPRVLRQVERNSGEYIRVVTKAALGSENERFRIEALMLLYGVGWSVASVVLHFGSTDSYPILDFRALWSVSVEGDYQYDFELWSTYTEFCRYQAEKAEVSMRTLDRALWAYSKENQGKR